ncbi:hypothetical protein GGTG_04371 [Gaeumannomyces tritici R3-111a-1]|uniref:Uncharacterized protein n=1 Tax=Gaeumannomyces tritici (strain R3-111a-1) TaxID=644352 RepID=J3NSX2_GAET3|nr:hypothetical protein GGTG_04371 [Gaeumannomyces tritici R3-111a-1]EJT79285.1 hypothetical protein GGTG_04371 [Gaeumannomyces tritici R3-111a-1]
MGHPPLLAEDRLIAVGPEDKFGSLWSVPSIFSFAPPTSAKLKMKIQRAPMAIAASVDMIRPPCLRRGSGDSA